MPDRDTGLSSAGNPLSSIGNPNDNALAQAEGEPKSVRDAYDDQQAEQTGPEGS